MIRGILFANTTKVTHLLRAHGCHVDQQLLKNFDDSTAAFTSRVLGGDLHEQALEQAALGLNQGGLGFRKAEMLGAPAHLASLVEARPCVAHLLRLASEAGIDLPGAAAIYDSNAKRPPKDCLVPLDPRTGHLLEILCSDASEQSCRTLQRYSCRCPAQPPRDSCCDRTLWGSRHLGTRRGGPGNY